MTKDKYEKRVGKIKYTDMVKNKQLSNFVVDEVEEGDEDGR